MVQKEAKVVESCTTQRISLRFLVNHPKSPSPPSTHASLCKRVQAFSYPAPIQEKRAFTEPVKDSGVQPMISATKTTMMRFAWSPTSESGPMKMTSDFFRLSNPYIANVQKRW